jgi:hypothetical protein
MKTLLKIVAGVALLALVGGAGWWWWTIDRARTEIATLRTRQEADFRAVEPKIAADEALVAHLDVFTPVDGPDAGPLLLKHVRFRDATTNTNSPEIPESLAKRLRTDWLTHIDDVDVGAIDLSWMASLPTYGFWDIESAGSPLEHRPVAIFTEAMPDVVDVQDIARVRLLQGLKSSTTRTAAAEVRALARLALSSENLLGEMGGVSLLVMERKAFEEAARRGEDTTGWTPATAAETDALKRVLFAALAPWGLASTLSRPFAVGTCAGLHEGVGNALYMGEMARAEYADRYAALGTALDKSPCRLRRLRAAWAAPSPTTTEALNTLCIDDELQPKADCPGSSVVLALPGARSFIINTLIVVAQPNWLRGYTDPVETTPTATTPTATTMPPTTP